MNIFSKYYKVLVKLPKNVYYSPIIPFRPSYENIRFYQELPLNPRNEYIRTKQISTVPLTPRNENIRTNQYQYHISVHSVYFLFFCYDLLIFVISKHMENFKASYDTHSHITFGTIIPCFSSNAVSSFTYSANSCRIFFFYSQW